ncbi:MAG: dihydrolipoamide acetyltransferase family protein [Nitrososphaerota archaeon]
MRQIFMPRIDPAMESGKVVEWLKREGDRVKEGEAVAVIEGEKTTFEITSPIDGILLRVLKQEGEEAKVGEPIAEIGEEAEVEERIKASPAARKLAAEYGIDLRVVKGTGPEGRITREDVLRAVEELGKRAEAMPEMLSSVKLTPFRKAMIQKLSIGFHVSIPVALMVEFDAEPVVTLLESMRGERGFEKVSLTALFVKAAAKALSEDRSMNAIFEEDEVKYIREVNIAVAVDTPHGLYAPVIKRADEKNVAEISAEIEVLKDKAMKGSLSLDELKGHTFTVSNLGTEGVDFFTPIINPPAIAILGVGKVSKKAVVKDEQIRVGLVCPLTLVFDHRVVDGAPAARFLKKLKQLLEEPSWIHQK